MAQQSPHRFNVGLCLPITGGWPGIGTARMNDVKTIAQHAEALGVDLLWVDDQLRLDLGTPNESPLSDKPL